MQKADCVTAARWGSRAAHPMATEDAASRGQAGLPAAAGSTEETCEGIRNATTHSNTSVGEGTASLQSPFGSELGAR